MADRSKPPGGRHRKPDDDYTGRHRQPGPAEDQQGQPEPLDDDTLQPGWGYCSCPDCKGEQPHA